MGSESPSKLWKGKGKAMNTEDMDMADFSDLNPVITYRHMLSNNLGVRDPLRVIALCDSDAFYAACEMNRLGVDKDTPLVVLQWDMLIAVNYPARKYGITRMEKKKDALKRCPHLKVVHVATYKEGEKEPGYWDDVDTNTHKVSLDYYRRESMKIAAMFKEELPNCEIEKASIDEAFFDFTKPVREIILQRYPYLSKVPVNAPKGVDTPLPPPPSISWNGLGSLIPICSSDSHSEESTGGGESDEIENAKAPGDENVGPALSKETEVENSRANTWHDVALSIAAELMQKARHTVKVKLGYTTSAGIARNKFLAKLSASHKKPDNQSILRNAAIPSYLRPKEFQKIRFLGGKLGGALAKEFDVSTVGDLLTISLDEMQSKFGENSVWVYEILRGIDRSEVKDKGSALTKSMLASKNLPMPITKASEGKHWIRVLAAELALRLKDAREISPNLWPKTIVLHARKGYEAGRSKQAPFPFTRDATVDTIAAAGDKLWKELVGNNTVLNVSSVQLAFTGIDVTEAGQKTIEGFLKPISSSSVKEAREPRIIIDDEQAANTVGNGDSKNLGNAKPQVDSPSYVCARCGETFELPTVHQTGGVDDQDIQDQLAKVKLEHDDFHFAQDLANEGSNRQHGPASNRSPSKKSKKRKASPAARGIEKFFRK